jgi:hypothetical protein
MRRMITLLVSVTIVIASATLAAFLFFLPESDAVRRYAEKRFIHATGLNFTIKSSRISYSFPLNVSIRLGQVEVTDGGSHPIFTAESIALSTSLAGILTQDFLINDMAVDSFRTWLSLEKGETLKIPLLEVFKNLHTSPVKGSLTLDEVGGKSHETTTQNRQESIQSHLLEGFTLKFRTIELNRGRISLIDRRENLSKETSICFDDIGGKVSHKISDGKTSVDLTTTLTSDNKTRGTTKIRGFVQMDLSAGEQSIGKLELFSESLDPRILVPFLGCHDIYRYIKNLEVGAELRWERFSDSERQIHATASVRSPEGMEINLISNALLGNDLKGIRDAHFLCDGHNIPLHAIGNLLPGVVPLRTNLGAVSFGVEGTGSIGNWMMKGKGSIENAVLSSALPLPKDPIRISAGFELSPKELNLISLEASESSRLLWMTGKVLNPLSGEPALDLKGELSVSTEGLWNLAGYSPDKRQMVGPILAKAAIKGNPNLLLLDIEADLNKVSWVSRPKYLNFEPITGPFVATVQVSRFGSKDASLEGKGNLTLNFIPLVTDKSAENSGLRVKGRAPFAIKFSGNSTKAVWSTALDLTGLELASEGRPMKPADAKAQVDGAGRWSPDGLVLDVGHLKAPGLAVTARGLFLDRDGAFGKLNVDLKSADAGELFSHDKLLSRMGISGMLKASLVMENSQSGPRNSGSIYLSSLKCYPKGAYWNLNIIRGKVEFSDQVVTVSDVAGRINGYVESSFLVSGSLKNARSFDGLSGNFTLAMGKGKVKGDRIVPVLTTSHSLLANIIKPRPVAMKGDFIEFDEVRADFAMQAGQLITNNFQMKGQQIFTAALSSLKVDTLELNAVLGIQTNVIGSETLEAVPGLKELMESRREKLPKVPVTVFGRISGSLLSSLNVAPLKHSEIDRSNLHRLEKIMKGSN